MPDSSAGRDPFAPVDASPRFATPLAIGAVVVALVGALLRLDPVTGPLGMGLGLIAHVKGSRWGVPAAVLSGVALIVGMSVTMYLR